jgi:hypothetical protein
VWIFQRCSLSLFCANRSRWDSVAHILQRLLLCPKCLLLFTYSMTILIFEKPHFVSMVSTYSVQQQYILYSSTSYLVLVLPHVVHCTWYRTISGTVLYLVPYYTWYRTIPGTVLYLVPRDTWYRVIPATVRYLVPCNIWYVWYLVPCDTWYRVIPGTVLCNEETIDGGSLDHAKKNGN